jgi:predicted nucleic acid-binding protein
VEAVELLEGDEPFIADTSAWWRFSSLPAEVAGLVKQAIGDDRLWITPIVRMEILYSTRSTSEYAAVETELDGFRILRNDRTDALIAAAAAEHGAIALLHRDTHFDKLTEVLTFENVELPAS